MTSHPRTPSCPRIQPPVPRWPRAPASATPSAPARPSPSCPRSQGLAEADAVAAIAAAGLQVGATEQRFNASVPAGVAVKTDPAAGSEVEVGSAVTLTLSKGPKPVSVPDIVGSLQKDARAAIEAAGLVVGDSSVVDDLAPKNTVLSQDSTPPVPRWPRAPASATPSAPARPSPSCPRSRASPRPRPSPPSAPPASRSARPSSASTPASPPASPSRPTPPRAARSRSAPPSPSP